MYAGRLSGTTFLAWAVAVVIATVAVALARRSARAVGAAAPRAAWGLLLPYAALALTLLAFTVFRAHPLAQYNDEATFRWAGAWGTAWIPLVLGTLAGAIAGVAGCLSTVLRGEEGRGPRAMAWAAVMVANGATFYSVVLNFPDA